MLVLVVFWLAPFFYVGWKGRGIYMVMPRLSFQHSAAGLFTKRTNSWVQHLFQFQLGSNEQWVTVDTEMLSPMGAFGYRQRLDRMLFESRRSVGDEVQLRMAAWLAGRCQTLFPMNGEVRGVRIVRTTWQTGTPVMARPDGKWLKGPFEGLPRAQTALLATFKVEKGFISSVPREVSATLATQGQDYVSPPVAEQADAGAGEASPPLPNRTASVLRPRVLFNPAGKGPAVIRPPVPSAANQGAGAGADAALPTVQSSPLPTGNSDSAPPVKQP
jgi:hypothetical protein